MGSRKRSRVFVGPGNTAGNAYHISKALNSVGVKTRSYSYSKHPFGYDTDVVIRQIKSNNIHPVLRLMKVGFMITQLNKLIRFFTLIKLIIKYDHFFFQSVTTIFRNYKDLPIIKFFGRKIAFTFVGCTERNPNDPLRQANNRGCQKCHDEKLQRLSLCLDLETKSKRIEYLEKYADNIFAIDDLVGFLKNKSNWNQLYYACDPIKESNLLEKFDETDALTLVHFPSNLELKGSKYINEAVKNIQKKFPDKINYINYSVSNKELKEILKKSHILIDQMALYHGLISVEAMSRGNVVVSSIDQWFLDNRPELPIIDAKRENIEDVLMKLVSEPQRLKSIAQKSIEYYQKYHSYHALGSYYKNIMDLNS